MVRVGDKNHGVVKDTMQKLEPRLCDSPSQVLFRKSTHNEIRDVVGRFFVELNSSGAVQHARCTAHSPCPLQTRLVFSLCLTRPCTFVAWLKPSRLFQLLSHGKVIVDRV